MGLDPYIVVGTGRSGTSTVARILHEKLNVFMGERLKSADGFNPQGYYEDEEFKSLDMSFHDDGLAEKDWLRGVLNLIEKRNAMGKRWGFKLLLAHLLGQYLALFDNPKIIRCVRDKELVLKSLMRCYGMDKAEAEEFWYIREKPLDRILAGRKHLVIDFGAERLEDQEIMNTIIRRFGRPIKIYLAVLNRGWLRREFAWNTLPMLKSTEGIELYWENPNITWANPISSNRNCITKRFLNSDCDFLLMIDDDIVPYYNILEYVYADKDIIGFPAKVRQKAGELNWVAYQGDGKEEGYYAVDFAAIDPDIQLLKVDIVGTGAILIKRKVLEDLKAPFHIEFDEDGISKFGTDFAFCRKARAAGFEVYTAPHMICEHIKQLGLIDIQGRDDSDYRDHSPGRYNIPWGQFAIMQRDWHFMKPIIEEIKPKRILEFGAGLSSCLMSEMAEVVSYEMDEEYAKEIKEKAGDNPLEIKIWDGEEIEDDLGGFDLAFVDGPQGVVTGGTGRQHSIRIASEVADRIIVHDAGRRDEMQWQEKYLRGKFKLERRSGYYQTACHYWVKKPSVEKKT